MAFPTLFRVVADFIGIGVGQAMNRPRVTSEVAENSKAFCAQYESDKMRLKFSIEKRREIKGQLYEKLKKSGLWETDKGEANRIHRQILMENFVYVEDYFKRKFPNLK